MVLRIKWRERERGGNGIERKRDCVRAERLVKLIIENGEKKLSHSPMFPATRFLARLYYRKQDEHTFCYAEYAQRIFFVSGDKGRLFDVARS